MKSSSVANVNCTLRIDENSHWFHRWWGGLHLFIIIYLSSFKSYPKSSLVGNACPNWTSSQYRGDLGRRCRLYVPSYWFHRWWVGLHSFITIYLSSFESYPKYSSVGNACQTWTTSKYRCWWYESPQRKVASGLKTTICKHPRDHKRILPNRSVELRLSW